MKPFGLLSLDFIWFLFPQNVNKSCSLGQ
uniref:Uncharacterized protein n=1 Tax=Rhizophora mucronata TaxID=61149 RepID=A0A2P2QHE4_RHIMU